MIEFETFRVDAGFLKQLFGVHHPFHGPDISLDKVAAAHFAAGYHDTVRPFNESLQDHVDIHFPGAGKPHDTGVGGILLAHGARQVCRGERAVVTAEGYDVRIVVFHDLSSIMLFVIPREGGESLVTGFHVL